MVAKCRLKCLYNKCVNVIYFQVCEMSEDADSELDPRIQIELEKLNTTTDEINKLELEYDVCFVCFFASAL